MTNKIILPFIIVFAITLSAQKKDEFIFKEGLAIKNPVVHRGSYLVPDIIEQRVSSGLLNEPKEGEIIAYGDTGKVKWEKITSNEQGWFEGRALGDGYALFVKESDKEESMILEGMGHNMVYVNGELRTGNPYQYKEEWESWEPHFDYSLIPVQLKKGKNIFLFQCSRGILKAKLYKPVSEVMFNTKDVTLPDLITGKPADEYGAIVVINASGKELKGCKISAKVEKDTEILSDIPFMPPYSVRKVAFNIKTSAIDKTGSANLFLAITYNLSNYFDTAALQLRVMNPGDTHKETFISNIDGSVQYYAVNPASGRTTKQPAALFLSLHGANVEAINQAGSYYHKTWGHIVSPTNRRPFGFNWEDWGRLDAIEVYDIAKQKFNIDENRIYLTGHSMGGHGTWIIGANYPDRFAAIAPSAGWISFWTYRSRSSKVDSTPVKNMLNRAASQSNTFALAENYKQLGVYVLHGAEDKTVSADEARSMVKHLSGFHKDFVYYEQPGADHWWDNSDEDGADCVDWKPLFDFFGRHSRFENERIREINFVTANPGLSAKNYWVSVEAQKEQLKMSSINISVDPAKRRYYGSTKNIELLSIELSSLSGAMPFTIELDSQKISNVQFPAASGKVWIENKAGKWQVIEMPSANLKNPLRYGTFKDAFKNRVIFVYSTNGTPEENKWALEKARYDAEKLWYQGNGSVDIIADKEFNPSADPDRNVILYGNSNTNSAWKELLGDSPVQVEKGKAKFGRTDFSGDDICALFLRPRKGSNIACVGAVAASGIKGMNMLNRTPYFTPWVGMPDCVIFNSEILKKGDDAVLTAGFFGNDWSIENGDFVNGIK